MSRIDITGEKFGQLVAVREAEPQKWRRRWECRCVCGTMCIVEQGNLRSGHTKSCGCLANVKHGLSTSKEYRAWINLIGRCENPKTPYFTQYGGRGIKVCSRWRQSFDAFLEDMGPRPSPAHSVDRIDCNGDYEPGDCRWATQKEQMRNVRNNRLVEIDGETLTLAEAVERRGLKYNTVLYRLRRGKSVEEALR